MTRHLKESNVDMSQPSLELTDSGHPNSHRVMETAAPVIRPEQDYLKTHHIDDFKRELNDLRKDLDNWKNSNTNVTWEKKASLPRGIDYPDKEGRSLLEDSVKGMKTSHMCFSEFPHHLNTLLPNYIKITRPQLEEAKLHLIGAIKLTTRKSNTLKKFIYGHSDERDGILVWIDLCECQDNDGNVEVREACLIRIPNQTYTRDYPGGLMRYLDDMDDAYAGLDVLGNVFTPRQKMQNLLNNIQSSDIDSYLVSHCRDFFTTFEQCVTYLRKEAVRRVDFVGQLGTRKSKKSKESQSELGIDDLVISCKDLNLEPTVNNMRMINKVMTGKRKSESHISSKVWKQQVEFFGIERMREFIKFLNKQQGVLKSIECPNMNLPPIVAKQYHKGTANLTAQVEETDDMSLSSDDSMYGQEAIDRMKHVIDQTCWSGIHDSP